MAIPYNEILWQWGAYIAVIAFTFFILSRMMSGFLGPFLKVKTSFGRLILVKVRNKPQDYFRAGHIDKGFLIFKDAGQKEEKSVRRIAIPEKTACIYRAMGVNVIDVDDETNNICAVDFSVVKGFDAVKYENLYLRALYKPPILDDKMKLLIIGIIIVGLLAAGACWLAYQNSVKIEAFKAAWDASRAVIPGVQ